MESFRRCLVDVFVYIAKQPSTSQPLCRKDQRVHVITAVRGWRVQEPDSVDSRHTCSHSSLLSALLLSAIFILSLICLFSASSSQITATKRGESSEGCGWPPYLLLSLALHSAQGFPLQLLRLLSRAVAKTQEPSSKSSDTLSIR